MTTLRTVGSLLVCAWMVGAAPLPGEQENIALGKPYRMEPAPNYPHCTDAGDRVQLTDGKYVSGYFWVQPGTVGWMNRSPVVITLDLQTNQPISGVSLSTAAGVAGVRWPFGIYLWVSDDEKTWRVAGDLVALSANSPAPVSGYAVHRFKTDTLATHGRFVRLVIVPTGSFAFADEIEVYRGPDELLLKPAPGPVATNVPQFVAATRLDSLSRHRFAADLAAVRNELEHSGCAEGVQKKLQGELDALALEIPSSRMQPTSNFRTVFPLNSLHGRIFKVQAVIWREQGFRDLVVWPVKPWDMLAPVGVPQKGPVALDVRMMRNEYRSAAFDLSNPSDRPREVELSFAGGLPGGKAPDYIIVHEVPFTDTQSGVPVAAALPLAERRGDRFMLQIPPGLTRQVWLTFHSQGINAGEYHGFIHLNQTGSGSTRIPLHLKVYPLTFPEQPTLHLCGWDYTDQDRCYEVTPENRASLIRNLREHFVDSPWAQAGVLALGKYDPSGQLIEPPDSRAFKRWMERWPGARNYFVFASVGKKFAGFQISTAGFTNAVSSWINWWVGQLKNWNIQPEQLGLLLVDEPHELSQDHIIIGYAKVIRAAQPKVVIWEDPTWANPTKASPELFQVSDVLCPNLPMLIRQGKPFADFYTRQRDAGKELWFYSCSGPGRLLDPYGYHRMEPWFCWKYGAKGAGYWAFGDSNGASSWNEYLASRGAYTPLFLDANSVTDGKQMEAIREGVEDYEYLRILRERVETLEKKGFRDEPLVLARRLLDTAADRVTATMTSDAQIYWSAPKDRSVADRVRIEILGVLEQLGTK